MRNQRSTRACLSRAYRLLACISALLITSLTTPGIAWADISQSKDPDVEAAALLNIRPQVEQAIRMKSESGARAPSDEEASLQLLLVRKIMAASLEVRKMAGILDSELSAEYAVQGEMIASRNTGIEINNSANFIQNGALGLISGGIGYAGANNAGDDLNIISGSLILLLSSIALLQTRGGKRPSESSPNMLAQILSPDTPSDQRFSPLVWTFLNTVPSGAPNGLTRREHLIEHWKKSGVLTINLNNPKNFDKLAAYGPGHKKRSETIKLITNRIKMLHDVHTQVETLDSELVALLHTVD